MARLIACLLVVLAAFAVKAADAPNIVLILADDLGINDLSCYGRKDQPTPNLDRLAADGMRFTSAYCAQPICSPSRAALMTGKHPARLHLTNFLPGRPDAPSQKLLQPVIEGRLPLEEVTIAEVLRDAGYKTACIGKWHLGGNGFGPKEQGFDHVYAGRANTKPTENEGSKWEYDLTSKAEEFIEQNKDARFFLYLAHNTPHIPFAATEEDRKRHDGTFNPTYAAVIHHMDASVGRLLAKLDTLNLREKTIVIFASDNGGLHVLEFSGTPATHNTPFRAGKGYLYEGGTRVPLIVRWPGKIRPGSVVDTPVVLTDLVPTLMHIVGRDPAKTTGPLDGVNLMPVLAGEPGPNRALYWHFPNYTNQGGRPGGAIREGNWKLIEHYEDGRIELFDLAKDQGEKNDLAAAEPDRTRQLQEKLANWRKYIGAQEMKPNPDLDSAMHAKLYVDHDFSRLEPATTAAEMERATASWRVGMNAAREGRQVRVTPDNDVRLHAKDAKVHGSKLRYEPESYKNTLGYWTNVEDWASWAAWIPSAGRYEVEVLQGCGKGSGGSKVRVEIGGQALEFTVQETGHFQNFIQRTIGIVELPAGEVSVAVKPRSKPGAAVMDLRRIVLRPAEAPGQ